MVGGRSDFFAVREKKFDRPPCVSHRSVVDGGTPRGGVPPGGPPLGGSPPLLSKTDFFEKFEKDDALSRPYAHFGPQKPCFWGGVPKIGVFGRF